MWTEISKKSVIKSFVYEMFHVEFRSQKSGKQGTFDVLQAHDWMNIVPVTKDQKVVMVKQFRFGSASMSLEFPAGRIEKGEDPKHCAERELVEESGARGEVTAIGISLPNPAFMSNTCYFF